MFRLRRRYNRLKFYKDQSIGQKMNKTNKSLLAALIIFTTLISCAPQQEYKPIEKICSANLQKQSAIHTAEEVLADLHFTVDKSDAEQGVIRTKPLQAAQLFEFWRKDNVGSFNTTEANLHTIRRIAELNISQQDSKLCVHCKVKVQRLSLSERKGTSEAIAYDKFSRKGAQPSRLSIELNTEQKTWIDLGTDNELATDILKRIEKKITQLQ